ncbi:MAG: 50S ribosomal protein L9 [Magnetococcales bacterium]|nr:50S ribosomal protein L9 [Magnetococcales bacterium]
MELILLEKVEKLGDLGETVTVRNGYGRNFLIPKGKALQATPANKVRFEREREAYEQKHREELKLAEEIAAQLEDIEIVLDRPAGMGEKLFGSVTNNDVALYLQEKGIDIHRRLVEIPTAIRTLGEHVVRVRLHPDVTPEMTITVERSVRQS